MNDILRMLNLHTYTCTYLYCIIQVLTVFLSQIESILVLCFISRIFFHSLPYMYLITCFAIVVNKCNAHIYVCLYIHFYTYTLDVHVYLNFRIYFTLLQ